MELFSAHDTTLMGLLMVTGKWENQWPTYVTMFKVELFKDEVTYLFNMLNMKIFSIICDFLNNGVIRINFCSNKDSGSI